MQQNYQPCFCPKTTDRKSHEAQRWFLPSVSKGRAQRASNARGGCWEKWVQNVLVCGNTVESREGKPRARIQVLKKMLVLQSCPTLWDLMDCSPPGSSVHRILQARILEWVAISFSRGSSLPRDRTRVSRILGRRFNLWATREAHCGKFWKKWECQTTWPASWEICMQVRKQQLELGMEQQTGSK